MSITAIRRPAAARTRAEYKGHGALRIAMSARLLRARRGGLLRHEGVFVVADVRGALAAEDQSHDVEA